MRAGIAGASAGAAVTRALRGSQHRPLLARPLHVVAAGKAAGAMTAALAADPGLTIATALAIGTHRPDQLPLSVAWREGSHPFPDERSVNAGREALALASRVGPGETLLLLLSGGASALAAVPAVGLSLADKRRTVEVLMHRGADIHALNTVRKHLSAIKGGRLAEHCAGATLTLAVSDVVGDDLSVIGSGPGVPDPTRWQDVDAVLAAFGRDDLPATVLARVDDGVAGRVSDTPKPGDAAMARVAADVIAGRGEAVTAAANEAESRGYRAVIVETAVTGEARIAAREWLASVKPHLEHATAPVCVIAAGETTVRVVGSGRGGRNQEFALALVHDLGGWQRPIAVASAGTDGIDGPTDAAGAVVDQTSQRRADSRGLSADRALANNDAYPFFEALGDLIVTGRTDTNVGDIQILLAHAGTRPETT